MSGCAPGVLGSFLLLAALVPAAGAAPEAGADLSSLESVERAGARFRDGRRHGDAMTLLARRGVTWVRLRLWHTPAGHEASLEAVMRLSRRARGLGLHVLLDLHYSDTWADPGRQTPPAAWRNAEPTALADSVRLWTRDVLRALHAGGQAPDAIQLGNEVGGGMLWPHGRVFGAAAAGWGGFAALLRAAREGVDASGAHAPRVLLHHERGGDPAAVAAFVDTLRARGVRFDAVALSYYPWWHGRLAALDATLSALATRGLDAWIVETAHPWTYAPGDAMPNVAGGPFTGPDGFPATPTGQRDFTRALAHHARRAPNVRAVFWWEPADVPTPARGSAWENAAWFDGRGLLLPAGREFAAALRRR